MGDSVACVQHFRAASAVSALACYTLCSKNISCPGFVHLEDNDCLFCGVGSKWGQPTDIGASDIIKQWTEPRKCNSDRTCVACPQDTEQKTVQKFAGFEVSHSDLYLSESCLIYWPGTGALAYGDEDRPIKLYSNSLIQGPGRFRSPISVVGSNVSLNDLTLLHPVTLKNGASVTLTNVTVLSGAAVVAAEVEFDRVTLNGVTAETTLVALGHAAGLVELQRCSPGDPDIGFVLQEEENAFTFSSVTKDAQCDHLRDVNLTRLMNVFGKTYEEMYFNDGSLGKGSFDVRRWLLYTGLANLGAAFVLFLTTENLRLVLYKLSLPTKKKQQ